MAFRSSNGVNAIVKLDGFRIRLVYADTSQSAWTAPGTVRTDAMDGGWNDIHRLTATDGSNASTNSLPNIAGTAIVRSTGYGLAIPSTATITGVELAVQGRIGTDVDYFWRHVQLVGNGVAIGGEKANRTPLPKNAFPVIGGASDAWQVLLTSATLNSSDFGVEVSFFVEQPNKYGSVYLDSMPLRVWGCL